MKSASNQLTYRSPDPLPRISKRYPLAHQPPACFIIRQEAFFLSGNSMLLHLLLIQINEKAGMSDINLILLPLLVFLLPFSGISFSELPNKDPSPDSFPLSLPLFRFRIRAMTLPMTALRVLRRERLIPVGSVLDAYAWRRYATSCTGLERASSADSRQVLLQGDSF